MPCAVLRASCAHGGPEQKQRRRRLARPERPRCPISALRQADGETVFSAASRPDAARARLARPRAATHAERAHKTRSVLSKKDRTAVVFSQKTLVVGFSKIQPPRCVVCHYGTALTLGTDGRELGE